ncbi:hypothetical protein [Bellilinea sp.]
MKKNVFSLNREQVLYALIFLSALTLRFVQLGKISLNDGEARLALQALSLARGENALYSNPDGGYLLVTTALFYLLSASDFVARLLPAFSGALICLLPYAFRKNLGKKTALILAIGLALDGGWLAAGRAAGSYTWAILFFLLTIGAINARRWKAAGVFGALALLGGVEIWKGLLPFLIAFWLYQRWLVRKLEGWDLIKSHLTEMMIWAGGTALVVGSVFLILPIGLSAMGGGLIAYLRGWSTPANTPIGLLFAAMAVYQLPGLLLGVVAAIRQIKQPVGLERFLTLWLILSLFHTLIYPGREVLDVVWLSIPLFGLAARLLASFLRIDFDQRVGALVYAFVVFTFLAFILQNLLALFSPMRVAVNTQPQVIAILAAAFFVIASIILIGWGWSMRVAGYGAVWGLLGILTIFWLSGGFHAAGLGEDPETNPFWRGNFIPEADLLKDTIGDLSELNVRSRTGIDVVGIGLDQPAMRWLAREYPNFVFENTFQPQLQNSIVLTSATQEVFFNDNYRGQDFQWEVQPIWDLMTSQEWLQWAIFKKAPLGDRVIVLWARESLFPGSEISSEVQP